jgi:LPS-assembly lipoprotein
VNSFTGYSATGTTVSAQAARQDAEKRLMVILGDLLIDKLIATADLSS